MWSIHRPAQERRTSRSPFAPATTLSSQREALARCEFLIAERRPFGLIAGGLGVGKSDLLRQLASLPIAPGQSPAVLMDVTTLDGRGFLRELADQLHTVPARGDSHALLRGVRERLAGIAGSQGHLTILIDHLDAADDALYPTLQHLLRLPETRGVVTLLATANNPDRPGLADLQREFGWLRIELPRLEQTEFSTALRVLMDHAPGSLPAISSEATRALCELSQGSPQELERLLSLSVLAAEADGEESITEGLVYAAAGERGIALV